MDGNLINRLVQEAKGAWVDTETGREPADARRQQEAVLALRAAGLSVRVIAARLGNSPSVVRDALRTAISLRPRQARREELFPYELHVLLTSKLHQQPEPLRASRGEPGRPGHRGVSIGAGDAVGGVPRGRSCIFMAGAAIFRTYLRGSSTNEGPSRHEIPGRKCCAAKRRPGVAAPDGREERPWLYARSVSNLMVVPATRAAQAKSVLTLLTALVVACLLSGCGPSLAGTSSPPAQAPASSPSSGAGSPSTTVDPRAASNGLVHAAHSECDFGDEILRYLATGDNQGNPKMDTSFSQDVGAPLPQAPSIADRSIQQCDTNLSKQEGAQASAQASVQAKASSAAAEAQASAQAAQDKAVRQASEEKVCAEIGGQLRDGGRLSTDLCVSTSPGISTEGSLSCRLATIPFQQDGTLSAADIAVFKSGYPGCFP